jgi:Domain of unknown function (DUF4287)/Bacteriocin-protection, YdeI or OmpD-Associated/Domain of unknown function (DUF1905)
MTSAPPAKAKGPASYFPSIERTYGRAIDEWKAMIRSSGITKHSELVTWLKTEHAMGHGHATALVAHTLAESSAPASSVAKKASRARSENVGAQTFTTTLSGDASKTGIVIPDAVIAKLGAGSRPAVAVTINGFDYRSTVAVMGGQHMVGVSAAIRKEAGLVAGDAITVTLSVATTPRDVVVPPDFANALAASPPARAFFDALANSLQRFHVDTINDAKTDETRQRRIAKAVELFLAGKKR